MDVTLVAEEIGGAPQQLDARPLLLLLQDGDNAVQVGIRLAEVLALGETSRSWKQ